jgi:hypothetical protein
VGMIECWVALVVILGLDWETSVKSLHDEVLQKW